MTVVRGATTILEDSEEEIRKAVKELLEQIESRNDLKRDEMMSLVFSSTSDIHSYYPAKAAREAGFQTGSLFSAQEPDIDGGLKLCIRVMVFIERNFTATHVYLRGARVLRKDLSGKINIAIDGPAGSGKSTLAKSLARDFHIIHIDTGAMYRACALKVLESGVDIENETAVYDLLLGVKIDVDYVNEEQITMLDGVDVSEAIRRPYVSMAASTVSKYRSVRYHLTDKQREIAKRKSCVLDGRDIGTFVLPDADFKFFLTADPHVRAKRRFDELTANGYQVDFDQILEEIQRRDEQDSTRAFAPLKKADDAVELDTSNMTIEEVLAEIKRIIQEKI